METQTVLECVGPHSPDWPRPLAVSCHDHKPAVWQRELPWRAVGVTQTAVASDRVAG